MGTGYAAGGWQQPPMQPSQTAPAEATGTAHQPEGFYLDRGWRDCGQQSGPEHPAYHGDDEEASNSTSGLVVKTGKEFVLEFVGTTAMRDYQRRVRLYEASSGVDPSYRAQKLMQRLTGQAWLATETLSVESLKDPRKVDRLLDHLWKELEPLHFLRVFQTFKASTKALREAQPGVCRL